MEGEKQYGYLVLRETDGHFRRNVPLPGMYLSNHGEKFILGRAF